MSFLLTGNVWLEMNSSDPVKILSVNGGYCTVKVNSLKVKILFMDWEVEYLFAEGVIIILNLTLVLWINIINIMDNL